MTVSLWDGHFDPDELAIKPVSIYSSFICVPGNVKGIILLLDT